MVFNIDFHYDDLNYLDTSSIICLFESNWCFDNSKKKLNSIITYKF
jgi:hypothetical protein